MNDPAPSLSIAPSRPWRLGATLIFSGIIFSVFLLVQTLVVLGILSMSTPRIPMHQAAQNGWLITIATLVSSPICVVLILGIAKLRKQLSLREYLGLRRPPRRALLEWGLITVMCSMALDLLKLLADLPIVPPSMIETYETAHLLPLFYLAVVVVAPIFEELFFRGFIYQGIRYSFLGIPGAIVLPAILWGLIHIQYEWFDKVGIFIFGVVLGCARMRSRSTYVTIAMHALNNSLALVQVAVNPNLF